MGPLPLHALLDVGGKLLPLPLQRRLGGLELRLLLPLHPLGLRQPLQDALVLTLVGLLLGVDGESVGVAYQAELGLNSLLW